jgi:hypothetical protein
VWVQKKAAIKEIALWTAPRRGLDIRTSHPDKAFLALLLGGIAPVRHLAPARFRSAAKCRIPAWNQGKIT